MVTATEGIRTKIETPSGEKKSIPTMATAGPPG
jgi:hypothetical protein